MDLELTRHEKALGRLLTDPYVHRTTIRDAFRCSYKVSGEIFKAAKELDLKKSMIDPRPFAVQSQTVLKVTGSNYSYLKKQLDNKLSRKAESNGNN